MAQYFRDALSQDVLIFIDNVFRFLQAIYVPADNLTDPVPVVIFGHLDLDAVTVLSRALSAKGIYLQSIH